MYQYKAKIVNVVDGDTVDAVIDIGFKLTTTQRLRLYGVNTPELHAKEDFVREAAQKAREFTKEALLGKDVEIYTHKSDSFGRYLARVFLPNSAFSFNRELLDAGYAVPYMQEEGAL